MIKELISFIFFLESRKLSQNTLELTETSLDIELYGNNLRVVVSEGTILPNVLVHESVSSVSILIATTNSVHRLVFPHPSKGRQVRFLIFVDYFLSGPMGSVGIHYFEKKQTYFE